MTIQCFCCKKKINMHSENYVILDITKVPVAKPATAEKIYICESCFADRTGDGKNFKNI